MRLKAFTAVTALLFIAACATAPEESGDASGSGGAAAASTGSSTQTARASTGTTQEAMKSDAPKPGSYEEFVANVGDRVLFEFDKFDLQAQARQTLDRQAAWLKQYPSVTVRIEGHCDERGTREYNLALGQRRAASVRDYLVVLGVSASRVDVISYGKERPEVVGSNKAAWSQNRRGVTTIN